jgi:hypothetical protein
MSHRGDSQGHVHAGMRRPRLAPRRVLVMTHDHEAAAAI